MATKKRGKEHIRKVQRSGGSYLISIPLMLMKKLGWRERQKVTVKGSGKSIKIKDWEKKKKSRKRR